jgi:hypothetical protein
MVVPNSLSVGQSSGAWCGFGAEGDQPGDQRDEDALSLCFDTPVTERTEILGAPVLRMQVSCDKPFGQLIARLCDVGPDGSLRVSYGVLNLQHRDSHEHPTPLAPGKPYDITLQLNDCGHAFAPGHTLRVALSTSYWPLVRPEREPFNVTVHQAALDLPVRTPRAQDAELPEFAPAEAAAGVQWTDLETPVARREVTREGNTLVHRFVIDANEDGGPAMSRLDPIDLDIGHSIIEELRITEGEPNSAKFDIAQEVVLRRKGWDVRVRTEHRMRSEPNAYNLRASVEAWEHDIAVYSRLWDVRIPR